MQIFQNEVFPFMCSNPSCEKEYKYNDFFLIASQWGYIYLANREYSIVGLTCPSCNTTTIKKCSPDSISLFEKLRFLCSKFIPFFSGGIDGLIYVDGENLYRVPHQITKIFENDTYPKWFEGKAIYMVAEDDLSRIIAYENKYQKMVLPRIISVSSIYNQTEEFFSHCKEKHPSMYGFEFTGHPECMYDIFIRIANKNYAYEDVHKDLSAIYELGNDYPQGFLEKIPDILNEYLQKRDRFDFQRSHKKLFLDKYIMEFFYAKGYYRSKKYFDDKGYYEDISGKQVKNIRWPVDKSENDKILSYTDLMKRWDKDVSILKHLIACGDLPAYNFSGVWLDITKPEVQNIDLHPKNFIYLESEVEELEIKKSWFTSEKSQKNNGKNSRLILDREYKEKRGTAPKDNSKEEKEILQDNRKTLSNLSNELKMSVDKLWDQTKELGSADRIPKEGLSDKDIEELRIINDKTTVRQLAEYKGYDSEALINWLNKEFTLQISNEDNYIDKSLIIRLLKENPKLEIKQQISIGENINGGIKRGTDPIKGKTFLVDALNVCRSFNQNGSKTSLRPLVTFLIDIIERNGNFICIFDANAEHVFDRLKNKEINSLKELLKLGEYFCLSTGRSPADDHILNRANHTGESIISNDKYLGYIEKYEWIEKEEERLIKGRVMGSNVSIPDLDIHRPVCTNLDKAVEDLIIKLS